AVDHLVANLVVEVRRGGRRADGPADHRGRLGPVGRQPRVLRRGRHQGEGDLGRLERGRAAGDVGGRGGRRLRVTGGIGERHAGDVGSTGGGRQRRHGEERGQGTGDTPPEGQGHRGPPRAVRATTDMVSP